MTDHPDAPDAPDDPPEGSAAAPATGTSTDSTADGGPAALVRRLAARLASASQAGGNESTGNDVDAGAGDTSRSAGRRGHVVELAVGRRPGVAAALADRGLDVVATDVRARAVPDGVTFVRDDLTDPDGAVYDGAALLYARNLPAELQRPARDLAVAVDAPLCFTTLGTEEPAVPVVRETLDDATGETRQADADGEPLREDPIRETLYRATDAPG